MSEYLRYFVYFSILTNIKRIRTRTTTPETKTAKFTALREVRDSWRVFYSLSFYVRVRNPEVSGGNKCTDVQHRSQRARQVGDAAFVCPKQVGMSPKTLQNAQFGLQVRPK